MFEDKKLDKGVIYSQEIKEGIMESRLCLGYSEEVIGNEVCAWYMKNVKGYYTKEHDDAKERFKAQLGISTYPISVVHVRADISTRVKENYEKGNLLYKGRLEQEIKRIFEMPYIDDILVQEYNFSEAQKIFTHKEGKTSEEIDAWVLTSMISGSCEEVKFYDYEGMSKLVDQKVEEYKGRMNEELDRFLTNLRQGYVKEYEVQGVYLAKNNKVLFYMGKTSKGKDAWVNLGTLNYKDELDLYAKVHCQTFKLRDRLLYTRLEYGKRNVRKLEGTLVTMTDIPLYLKLRLQRKGIKVV